jgi:hypothetical protein
MVDAVGEYLLFLGLAFYAIWGINLCLIIWYYPVGFTNMLVPLFWLQCVAFGSGVIIITLNIFRGKSSWHTGSGR